jgi:lysophospholipase L1-like esterase
MESDVCLALGRTEHASSGEEEKPYPKWLLGAYLAHLLLPLALLLDCCAAWRLHSQQFSDEILCAISGAWLAAAIGGLLLARDRARLLKRMRGPLAGLFALCITIAVFELALRATMGEARPALWTPGLRTTYKMDTRLMPGASPNVTFTVNRLGLRGPEMPSDKRVYKIVAVGGSTTECLVLTDAKTWPQRLMDELNRSQQNVPVWVGNAGAAGHTALHHLELLRDLPVLSQADALVFMIGINDLEATLVQRGGPADNYIWKDVRELRDRLAGEPEYRYPLFRHLYLFRLIRNASLNFWLITHYKIHEDDETGMRERRARFRRVPLPDLALGLREYRVRLERIAQECGRRHLRCIFLTQPSMWRSDLPPQEEALLVFGWVGRLGDPWGYLTVDDGKRALDQFNEVELDVCREMGMECLDVAAMVPKDSAAFYDDVHFNEGGAEIVAHAVASYFLSRPPFRSQSLTH